MASNTTTWQDDYHHQQQLSNAERRMSFMKVAQEQVEQAARGEDQQPFVPARVNRCQVEKFKALFQKFYDVDQDGVITEADFDALNKKIFRYTGWNEEDTRARKMSEYHKDLFQCLLFEINQDILNDELKKSEISLTDWLKMWDQNMHRSLAIAHLPQWVQLLPMNLFGIIDKNGRGHVTKQNLLQFYSDFMQLADQRARLVADHAWSQMTGNGDFKLTLDVYTVAFSNFLFAKNAYGPGLFILGTFDQCVNVKGFRFSEHINDE